jgi:hypothetical protein
VPYKFFWQSERTNCVRHMQWDEFFTTSNRYRSVTHKVRNFSLNKECHLKISNGKQNFVVYRSSYNGIQISRSNIKCYLLSNKNSGVNSFLEKLRHLRRIICINIIAATNKALMPLLRNSGKSNESNKFYKTPFCCTRFLEHDERSEECCKANKCEKWLIKRV